MFLYFLFLILTSFMHFIALFLLSLAFIANIAITNHKQITTIISNRFAIFRL